MQKVNNNLFVTCHIFGLYLIVLIYTCLCATQIERSVILQEYSVKVNRILSVLFILMLGFIIVISAQRIMSYPSYIGTIVIIICGFCIFITFSRLIHPTILTINKKGVYLYKRNLFRLHFIPWSKITAWQMMSGYRGSRSIAFRIENSNHEIDRIYWIFGLKQHFKKDEANLVIPLTFAFFNSENLMEACAYFKQYVEASENSDNTHKWFVYNDNMMSIEMTREDMERFEEIAISPLLKNFCLFLFALSFAGFLFLLFPFTNIMYKYLVWACLLVPLITLVLHYKNPNAIIFSARNRIVFTYKDKIKNIDMFTPLILPAIFLGGSTYFNSVYINIIDWQKIILYSILLIVAIALIHFTVIFQKSMKKSTLLSALFLSLLYVPSAIIQINCMYGKNPPVFVNNTIVDKKIVVHNTKSGSRLDHKLTAKLKSGQTVTITVLQYYYDLCRVGDQLPLLERMGSLGINYVYIETTDNSKTDSNTSTNNTPNTTSRKPDSGAVNVNTVHQLSVDIYNKISYNMSYQQVVAIVGFDGELQSENIDAKGEDVKTYLWIDPIGTGNMKVVFANDKAGQMVYPVK